MDAQPACTTDGDCGGHVNSCFAKANCFMGPPLEFPNPELTGLTTCSINVFRQDASGTFDPLTGAISQTLPLTSEVYITGNVGSPCPHCCVAPGDGTSCSGTCSYGARALLTCNSTSSSGTTQDCPPERALGLFQAPLAINLSPYTTAMASLTAADGNFCPAKSCFDTGAPCTANTDCTCLNPPACSNHAPCGGQLTAGAFGIANTHCIQETGSPAGDLTDGMPHAGTLAAVFCVPRTTNATNDMVADLPGPGASAVPGLAQIVPVP